MAPRFEKLLARIQQTSGLRKARAFRRLSIECLEPRTLLAVTSPTAAIVEGRMLATVDTSQTPSVVVPVSFANDVKNNQVQLTLTAYNEQANDETGVLITDTLAPGVTLVSASPQPNQQGQYLAWSAGTIHGFDRASVTLTVSLSTSTPLQLDGGAKVFATLDAGAVSNAAPGATLRAGGLSDPGLLASTPDANTTDPFIQEEAAKLAYDPQKIFDFLHDEVGYNSYDGSLRGARGTLWSLAGNALDVSSLGIALMRASGIPAQYVQGTLPEAQAQILILSMFPASYQTVGYIPANTQTSDPSGDSQLLAETQDHTWFRADFGNGMQDADPLFSTAVVGQTFTDSTGTFTEVPDALRQKTEIQLNAEIYSQIGAIFGPTLGGTGLTTTTVLDKTFNDVDLVGRPLSIGNFVSTSAFNLFFLQRTTNTYSPYIEVGDEAYPSSQDEVLRGAEANGKDYQEVITNFPLGTQVLTGLFLNVTLSGPDGPAQTYKHTILDRIGYAPRQNGDTPSLTIDPNGPPAINIFDVTTVNVLAGLQDPRALARLREEANATATLLGELNASPGSAPPAALQSLSTRFVTEFTRVLGATLLSRSDILTAELAASTKVAAYWGRPRLVVTSQTVNQDLVAHMATVRNAVDLLRDNIRVIGSPGQVSSIAYSFNVARGYGEDAAEYLVSVQSNSGGAASSAGQIITMARQQGISIELLTSIDYGRLASFGLASDATARITTALQAGLFVTVPASPVTIDGQSVTAWFETDPRTGYTIGVMENGGHQGIVEYAAVISFVVGLFSGIVVGVAEVERLQELEQSDADAAKKEKAFVRSVTTFGGLGTSGGRVALPFLTTPSPLTLFTGAALLLVASFLGGVNFAIYEYSQLGMLDPPIPQNLAELAIPLPAATKAVQRAASLTGTLSAGSMSANTRLDSFTISAGLDANWSANAVVSFQINQLAAGDAMVTGASGGTLGSGRVSISESTPVQAAVSGDDQFKVNGTGSLSFYGPAENKLGVNGAWADYSANITGKASITLTTDALTLNGQLLTAGTYTITTSSATLSGSGATSSPNFSGSVAITATNGTIELGPGTGNLSVGGKPLNATNETTLTGYSGTVNVSANGDGADSLALNGNAGHVLQVVPTPATLTTDQNTPMTFAANVQTSLADTYTLTANAPAGWTVTIDASGNVTATPAPGLQGGTYPIQIIAQSTTNPDLIAQSIVNVTITPTVAGLALNVASDPIFTVPFNGAQLPTAFRATIQNVGPATDTYNLTFSNVPAGFTLLNSGTSVAVPAGQTGILGLYLQPNLGQPIPLQGTPLSFTVTATSTTNPALTKSQVVSSKVPEIHAVTFTNNPTSVNTTPGAPVADTITITNVGNVIENNITLSATTSGGLKVSGLSLVTLSAGQSQIDTIMLTPDASTPLNSMLDATLTATFGPTASPATQTLQVSVQVVVPGAAAIANAAVAAAQLGNSNLANRLDDLSSALTNLVENPASGVYKSQSLVSLDAVSGLLANDAYLVTSIPTLAIDRAALAQASSISDIQADLAKLGTDLGSIGTTLADEAAHGFYLALLNSSLVGQPQVPTVTGIALQNIGSQSTTYDLSLAGLPQGVTGTFNQTSITLAPGQSTLAVPTLPTLIVTLTSTSATEIPTFSFTVQATAEGATEITRSTTGAFVARSNIVQVESVTTNPASTNPGGQVDVLAEILNAVNRQQQAEVTYTVSDSTGKVVVTSQPVTTTLNVLTTLAPVDLGILDTTNFANGQYTITVTVADATGKPIPNSDGQTTLLIGSPVTASLTTSPALLPVGNGAVTTTLQIGDSFTSSAPFSVEGRLAVPGQSVAVAGQYAYVGEGTGVGVVDVSNPASPSLVRTIGTNDFPHGLAPVTVKVSGGDLFVNVTNSGNSTFLVYSLADPANPSLVGNSSINGNYPGSFNFVIQGKHAYLSSWYFQYFTFGSIFAQRGDLYSVDITNLAAPRLVGSLYGPSSGGGNNFIFEAAVADDHTLFVAGTSSTGGNPQSGVGQIFVVDTTDPANPKLRGTVDIPGSIHLQDIAINGNQAVVLGSSGGLNFDGNSAFPGNIVVATLDITDHSNPKLIASRTLPLGFNGKNSDWTGNLTSLGNDLYVASNPGTPSVSPALLLIDAQDPSTIQVTPFNINNAPIPFGDAVLGSFLYTVDPTGLVIYNIAPATTVPITAKVTVPTSHGVSIDTNSFSLAPTSVTAGNGTETLEWDLNLPLGNGSQTITWRSNVSGLQPAESRPVANSGTVQFAVLNQAGTLNLPAQFVAGEQIIGLNPASRSVAPATPASYSVTLLNPTASPVSYRLSVQGVPGSWVSLAPSVTVAANGSIDVPLILTSDSFAALGDDGFTVSASGDNGAMASVQGDLVLQGTPVLPGPNSHGVVATITPDQATVGLGTSTSYVVQLTNTGSTDDSFGLSISGLPAGITASFNMSTIDVPPGASNARHVTLKLTASTTAALGSAPFSVSAVSTTDPNAKSSASATLNVVNLGVQVMLTPPPANPGDTLQLKVTNTGTVADTYSLKLGDPAALVASLAVDHVSLNPGTSVEVQITTTAVNFAVQGSLNLIAVATSQANPAVRSAATSVLSIPGTVGLSSSLDPAVKVLPIPGTTDFLLMVNNTGNTEDSYNAVITGTSGPLTASLMGLDGNPTQTIPLFRLPGLSTGAILIHTGIATAATGTVSVRVTSLSNAARTASQTATVTALASTATATTTQLTIAPNPAMVGQLVTFTAIVAPTSGTSAPTGKITFTVDGKAQAPVNVQVVNGVDEATFSTSTLDTGLHTVSASYGGDAQFTASMAGPSTLTVNAQTPLAKTSSNLTLAPNPSAVGQAVTFVAIVSPATGTATPMGTVTFRIDGTAQTPVAMQVIGGQDEATFTTSMLTAGSHAISASYSGDSQFGPSTTNTVVQVVTSAAVDGPRVTDLQRFGFHEMPTTLVLTFDGPLDAAHAQDIGNYVIVDPHGHNVGITSATYVAATETVVLHTRRRLNVHRHYQLTLRGTGPNGLTGSNGLLLDGNNDGRPGGNYVTVVNRNNLVLGVPTPQMAHRFSIHSARRPNARSEHLTNHGKNIVVKSGLKLVDRDSHARLGGGVPVRKRS